MFRLQMVPSAHSWNRERLSGLLCLGPALENTSHFLSLFNGKLLNIAEVFHEEVSCIWSLKFHI